jgi:hypothetical protein
MKDKVVEAVCKDLKERSKVGIEKYGLTLDENNDDDFLQHAYEVALDLSNYLKKLLMDRQKNMPFFTVRVPANSEIRNFEDPYLNISISNANEHDIYVNFYKST